MRLLEPLVSVGVALNLLTSRIVIPPTPAWQLNLSTNFVAGR
jgi:hypothetical protein